MTKPKRKNTDEKSENLETENATLKAQIETLKAEKDELTRVAQNNKAHYEAAAREAQAWQNALSLARDAKFKG